MKQHDHLTIGQLARAAQVNVETIRYYQRKGLLQEPEKPPEGYRRYPATTLRQIDIIKRAQRVGFTLREISQLLSLGQGHCQDIRRLAEQKIAKIEQQLVDLQGMKETLVHLSNQCSEDLDQAQRCLLLDNLMNAPGEP